MTDKDILIASAHVYGAAFAAAWATGSGASKEDLYTRGIRAEKAEAERAARIANYAAADFVRWATAQAKTTELDPRPIAAGDVVKIVESWTMGANDFSWAVGSTAVVHEIEFLDDERWARITTGRSTGSAPCRCLRRVESTK